jgi:hypothetical protein
MGWVVYSVKFFHSWKLNPKDSSNNEIVFNKQIDLMTYLAEIQDPFSDTFTWQG